jgi:hypothetical protein
MMNEFISFVESASNQDLVKLSAECDYAVAHGMFHKNSFCYNYYLTSMQNTNNTQTGSVKVLDMCMIVSFEVMHRVANGTFK